MPAPGLVPAKSFHMQQRDLPALSRYYHLPIRIPSNYAHFMYNTLSTMRTLTAIQIRHPHKAAQQTQLTQPTCRCCSAPLLIAVVACAVSFCQLADASRMLWEYAWQRDEDILQQSGQH
jgi:hypothetical protein